LNNYVNTKFVELKEYVDTRFSEMDKKWSSKLERLAETSTGYQEFFIEFLSLGGCYRGEV